MSEYDDYINIIYKYSLARLSVKQPKIVGISSPVGNEYEWIKRRFVENDMKYSSTQERLDQITNSFTYHSPKDDQPERYVLLRDEARALAFLLLSNVPPGREQALAITKLEESIMWANKGIACGEK